jgi:hypothetical protein
MTAAMFFFLYLAGYLLTLAWFMRTLLNPRIQKVIRDGLDMDPGLFIPGAVIACIVWPLVWASYIPLTLYLREREPKP